MVSRTPLTTQARLAWRVVTALALTLTCPSAQTPPAEEAVLTLLSADARRTLATTMASGQLMVALDDLAATFQLTVREEPLAGGLSVGYKGKIIVLAGAAGLASVGGRLISLPSPPVRQGRRWLVPVEFIDRALARVYESKLELRKASKLVIIGTLRVPRVVATYQPLGTQARVIFEVTPATPHSVTQEGGRLEVSFDADALDAALPARVEGDLVSALRAGRTPASVAIEVTPRLASFRSSVLPSADGSARVTIDLQPVAAGGSPEPAPLPEASPRVDRTPAPPIQTIVIDPGHGGEENGARGPTGTLEKHITLEVARRLKAAIEARLGLRVILTRDSDQTVNLDERAAIANNNKADLFISLHANASVRPAVSGAEVFLLSIQEYSEEVRRRAAAEGELLPAVGGGMRQIEAIPWDMAQVRFLQESAALARVVEHQLRTRVPMSPRALQEAPFRVLVGANMPAVLVEMGFLSNPEEERRLVADAFQNTLALALVDGIVEFRHPQEAGEPPSGDERAGREPPPPSQNEP